ncbi:MAG: hypothetical protein ABI867_02920 [Kofleriaceae bacterium]
MRLSIVLILVAAACGSKPQPEPNDEVCTHYAKLMVACAKDDSSPTVLNETSHNFCMKGMSGKYEQMFGAHYRRMIECTRTAETCDALAVCQDAP